MIPILYTADETEFTTNGLGRLVDCISCEVTEERNGVYEIELVYPVDGHHYGDIEIGRIIYTTHDATKDPQPFDIYKKSTPIDGNVTFYAHHISYRLNEHVVRPFSVTGTAGEALNALKTNSINTCHFTFASDKTGRLTYKVREPDTIRRLLGGQENSILDVYGSGDYTFDDFSVTLGTRGADRGVTVRYGKNLTDITAEANAEGSFNGVVPFWANEDSVVLYSNGYVTVGTPSEVRLAPLDLSDRWENAPRNDQLYQAALDYLNDNKPWEPDHNIEVGFAALWQTEDYATVENLQRIVLCDTVGVYFVAAGVSAKMRVVKVVYDSLADKYISIELGTPHTSLASTIEERTTENVLKTAASKDFMADAIEKATDLIAGGLGGYVVIGRNANGQPEEILIMDAADTQTAVNVIRMNKAGIGFSTSGYAGPFTSAWTIDGTFNTDFIHVTELSALTANMGTVTAGALQSSDYAYTSGRYTDSGMIIDLNNKVIRTPKTAILADGTIYSTSVNLSGDMTTTGQMAGYDATTYINGGYIKFYINNALVGKIWPYAWGDDYVDSQGIALVTDSKYLSLGAHAQAYMIMDNGLNLYGYTEKIRFLARMRTQNYVVSSANIYSSGAVVATADVSTSEPEDWNLNCIFLSMNTTTKTGQLSYRSSIVTSPKRIILVAEDGTVTYASGNITTLGATTVNATTANATNVTATNIVECGVKLRIGSSSSELGGMDSALYTGIQGVGVYSASYFLGLGIEANGSRTTSIFINNGLNPGGNTAKIIFVHSSAPLREGAAITMGTSDHRFYQVWSTSFNLNTGVYINYNATNDYIYASRTINQASDETMKNIEAYDERYDQLLDLLTPVVYSWKHSPSKDKHIGLGARATKRLLDDLGLTDSGFVGIDTRDDGSEIYSIGYTELTVMLLYAVQKLRNEIKRRAGNA